MLLPILTFRLVYFILAVPIKTHVFKFNLYSHSARIADMLHATERNARAGLREEIT